MTKPIVNLADVELRAIGNGGKFVGQSARLGPLIGAERLGCQLQIIPPGKAAYPRHAHHVNEEMFVILSGEGEYRVGEATYPIHEGDVISAPPGDGTSAHQIFNSGSSDLRFLSISTRLDPEVIEYPDSNKFAVASMISEQQGTFNARLLFIGRQSAAVGYYDGEE